MVSKGKKITVEQVDKEEHQRLKAESKQRRQTDQRQVTVSDVLQLISQNKKTENVSAMDKESKAQLRDVIG